MMPWNPEPKIRELVEYAKKHNFVAVVAICIRKDKRFEVQSVGDTARSCKLTGPVGDRIFQMIEDEEIRFPEF